MDKVVVGSYEKYRELVLVLMLAMVPPEYDGEFKSVRHPLDSKYILSCVDDVYDSEDRTWDSPHPEIVPDTLGDLYQDGVSEVKAADILYPQVLVLYQGHMSLL